MINANYLKGFTGTHPETMSKRITMMNWRMEPDELKIGRKMSLRSKV